MSLVLAKFYWDCHRQGSVTGLFVAEKSEINEAYGCQVYFGEILGKHSEVYGTLEQEDIEIISEDEEKIKWLQETIDSSSISGYNPLEYIDYYCDECGYEYENIKEFKNHDCE